MRLTGVTILLAGVIILRTHTHTYLYIYVYIDMGSPLALPVYPRANTPSHSSNFGFGFYRSEGSGISLGAKSCTHEDSHNTP